MHIRRYLLALLMLTPMTAGTASPANYLVQGNVPQICSVELPVLLTNRPAVNVSGLTGESLTINQLTDPATLATNATSFDVGFAAVCDVPHQLVIESQNNGLWRDILTTRAPGFADAVPYKATVSWGNADALLTADATVRHITSVSVTVDKPVSGDIDLHFSILSGASNSHTYSPLLAGTYRDTIRVTVVPQ